MTNRTIEVYVIEDCSGEYARTEAEYFDTFDDAVAHINDTFPDGRFKYTGWWSNGQECSISKKVISPKYRTPVVEESWQFKNSICIAHAQKSTRM